MKSLTIVILALSLCSTPFSLADNHTGAKQQETLKYIEFSQIGDPADVLEVKEESSRPLKSGEVRVAVLASPINPSDLLQIAGKYGVDPVLPSNPGSEGVGRVLEVSAEVKHLTVGHMVLLASGGTWRDEIVAPAAGFLPRRRMINRVPGAG